MDEALRRYQQDIARAQISRRRFMTLAALGGRQRGCSPRAAPAAATAAPSAAASTAASAAAPAASAAAPAEARARRPPSRSRRPSRDLFMFNWSTYFADDNKAAFETTYSIAASRTTPTRPTRSCWPSSRPAARASTTSRSRPPSSRRRWPTAASSPKLDKSRLPNLAKVNERFLTLPFDPERRVHRAQGLGHDRDHLPRHDVKEPVTSWKDFFDLAKGKYSGKTLVVNSPGDVFVAPLSAPRLRRQHHDTASWRSPARSCWRCGRTSSRSTPTPTPTPCATATPSSPSPGTARPT